MDLLNAMSPYLLLGFFLAGLMHVFVPAKAYRKYLSAHSFKSVVHAALLGIPLPLCSCGVIPTAMSLQKEGASKGAVTSFLIATPQTGIDSIMATFALMGLPFAIIRPVAALATALLGGWLVNRWDDSSPLKEGEERTCPEDTCHPLPATSSWTDRMKEALRYAFVDMMADIGKWLVIGLLVAAAITQLVPDSYFTLFADNSLLSMLLVLLMAIPMYLCATGSIPIAVALILKGITPGAGLVLLMAGPASNIASILVIRKVLGARTQALYLGSIIVGAIAAGLVIDLLLPTEWLTGHLILTGTCEEGCTSPLAWGCSIVLCLLLANALLIQPLRQKRLCHNASPKQHPTSMEQHIQLQIKGMNCHHCQATAEKALASVEGVTAVQVDLASGKAFIQGNASVDQLKKAVEAVGFTAVEG